MRPKLTIVVAIDSQYGIGINNTLPWHLPEDLAHFKRTTSGHPIIMGRKTFDSIGRPLPNRRNIVVTRNPKWQQEGVEQVSSLDEAIKLVDTLSQQEGFVIGGAQIFTEALPRAQKMIVTEIEHSFSCDTFFPAINSAQWQETTRIQHYSDKYECNYAFVTYERKPL